MRPRNKLVLGTVVLAVLSAAPLPLWAQQESNEKPKPAAREYPPVLDVTGDQQDVSANQESQNPQPDTGPLTGVQNPTLGAPKMGHSYWVPGIQYGNTILSNSVNSSAVNRGWNSASYVAGNLSLSQGWRGSQLSANYSGGGYFSTDSIQGSGQFQQLALGYQLEGRRWQLLFIDQFAYLPESAFGFGASTGLSIPGIGGSLGASVPGLQNGYVPSQSIVSTIGPRYSNASAVQLTYQLSARGSITFAGTYGILRFIEPGNVENNAPSSSVGYNFEISRKDTIGVSYRFSAYQYPGIPQALGDQVAQVAYGRKITGRMALQIAGGPEITTFRIPIGNTTRRVSGSGNASLTYAFARSSISLNYSHGLSGGSGVFTGADTDQIGAGASRRLSRIWQGNLNFWYARNNAVVNLSGQPSPGYNTWYASAGLSRPLGRTANFSLAYQALIQEANLSACNGPGCGQTYTQHQITLSFQWHTRPLVIR